MIDLYPKIKTTVPSRITIGGQKKELRNGFRMISMPKKLSAVQRFTGLTMLHGRMLHTSIVENLLQR